MLSVVAKYSWTLPSAYDFPPASCAHNPESCNQSFYPVFPLEVTMSAPAALAARGDARVSTLIERDGHALEPIENSSASGTHSDSTEEPPLSSPTPSLNLEAAAPASSGDKDSEAGRGKANTWLNNQSRGIQKSWPTPSRIARRIYRFFRGPSPPMPLPRMLPLCHSNSPT